MKTILGEWTEYEQTLIDLGAPPMQRFECKKAFYMGAALCLELAGTDRDVRLAIMHKEIFEFRDHLHAESIASSSAE